MGGLPSYASVAGMSAGALYRLLTDSAEPVLAASYAFTWQRDQALVESVCSALRFRRAVQARGQTTELGDAWLPGQLARLVLGLLGEAQPPAKLDLLGQRLVIRRMTELRRCWRPLIYRAVG